jgi:hypothetical protein
LALDRKSLFYIIIALASLLFSPTAIAQTTKVKGSVKDTDTGEGIPFANVYFKNTTIGVTTDLDGNYTMETRDHSVNILCVMILGYEAKEVPINNGSFNQVDFKLKSTVEALNAVIVKPDDHYVRWIMRQVDKNRDRNNPESLPRYECDTYNKMELDVTNADEQMRNKLLRKNFGFVFNYMDTSVVSGQPYLPVMISETASRYYHQNFPIVKREMIKATKVSGIEDEAMVAQFTGNMHVKTNFYDNFMHIFDVQLPSPLSRFGNTYYNYYLVDSLNIEGRKTYKIRFHPDKLVSSPTFDGEMTIDAKDFALRDMHARLKKGANVNWVKDFVVDVVNQPLNDSVWFYKQDKLYVDFAVVLNDSSKVMSFLGNREIDYSNPAFDPLPDKIVKADADVILEDSGIHKDETYWQAARPDPLTKKEQGIYSMVDSIKNVPLYNNIYTVISSFVTGYYDTKYIGIGPYFKTFSFNDLEGARFQAGVRTTSDFSDKWRFTLYGAYSTKGDHFKGGGTVEYMFDNIRTKKLTIDAKHDMEQLGKGAGAFTESNILSSILSKGSGHKLTMVDALNVSYEHEWFQGFDNTISLETRRIYANKFVPMLSPDSTAFKSISTNQLRYTARFSWDEIVTRGTFDKTYVDTDFPVVTLNLVGALKGISENDYSYLRTELQMRYWLAMPPFGASTFRFSAGKIFGTVPYPLLKIHEGNGTYYYDESAFSCMNYFEFVSDTWTTLFWEHNFKGFFLGKIPLMKKLNWREIVEVKAAYGTLSAKNNGILGSAESKNAPMLFPAGMSTLKKPYVEAGVGISNIFRVIRVDAVWRLNHRDPGINGIKLIGSNNFAVSFSLVLSF